MKTTAVQSIAAFAALAAAAPAPVPEPEYNATLVARGTDAPFGIKKGLAYNDAGKINTLSRSGSATWAYNWGAARDAPKFQGIPMMWGVNEGQVDGIFAKIASGDTPYVLGYNEPDVTREHGGCNASPQRAREQWGNDMFRFRDRGAKLVCPAISSWNTDRGFTGGPSGLTWLRQFAGNNPGQFGCSAQALHWYGEPGANAQRQAQLFIDYVAWAHGEVNSIFQREMPLWITEFSPDPVGDVNLLADFLRIVIPWLDRQDYVHRYAPFKAETMVNGNDLNNAGRAFVESRG
ncbi:hypothetical protein B0H66DRAFT_556328 [Apodospora peruviana]|uniref:Asl1-like glycosyl hydrolase catalytic domain-containing protein n=1 Tax=Apodospora peruviana TaxID=516989 RepID=A0AAE0M3L8_9PEZI|nr:hypothetical protein B0H66DRAFT_556328 [Apodospora peruviana]